MREEGFPGSSVGKESTCSSGAPGSISALESYPGEGIGYLYSWTSPMAQMVKNPPAMWGTWVPSLGWADPMEECWKPTPVFLPGESSWTEEPCGVQSMGSQRVIYN